MVLTSSTPEKKRKSFGILSELSPHLYIYRVKLSRYDTAMRRWGRGGGERDAPARRPSPPRSPFALGPGDDTLSRGGG